MHKERRKVSGHAPDTYTVADHVTFERLCASALKRAHRGEFPPGKTIYLYKSSDTYDKDQHIAGLVEIAVTVKILRKLT